MNKTVLEAMEMDQFNNSLPKLKVGEETTLGTVWDGEGAIPLDSYSYQLTDTDWINYEFEVIEQSANLLDSTIKITDISLV